MSGLVETWREKRVLRVALNRPQKRNALNSELCRELTAALDSANRDADVGAILLTGRGSSFSAGMDLFEAGTADAGELADVQERLFTAYAWLEKPLIAAVHGAALAGGTGLVANAHIVLAAPDAVFGLTEIHIGLWPLVIFRAMVHAVGERRALEMSLSGRKLSAAEACDVGLVHHLTSANALESSASAMSHGIAEASRTTIASGLKFVAETRGVGIEPAGRRAREFRQQIFASQDFRTLLEEFQEKHRGKA